MPDFLTDRALELARQRADDYARQAAADRLLAHQPSLAGGLRAAVADALIDLGERIKARHPHHDTGCPSSPPTTHRLAPEHP